ncbi:MAG: long-chain fatty acid--CoA ligase, partial [Acidimicrobiia bacterium]|nr:long-chain fatty acid--CoA ligase [Acidimicrobiia bacterium]
QWAEKNGLSFTDLESFASNDLVQAEIAQAVTEANNEVSRVEQAKKWIVAPHDWSPESGELTPSLKLKRRVVMERYAGDIDSMYAE